MHWAGPLAKVADEDTKHFRTFTIGNFHFQSTSYSAGTSPLGGFEITISDAKGITRINSITPIFTTGQSSMAIGKEIGTPNGRRERITGKPGYVVSGVALNHTGNYYAGIQVRFSRLLPDGTCDLNDSYTSQAFGVEGGKLLDAKPLPFCGINASPSESTILDGISFLVPQNLVREKAPELEPRARGMGSPLPTIGAAEPAAPAPPQPPAQIVVLPSQDPVIDPQVAEIVQNAVQRLVLVKGADGVGSGFVYKVNGRAYFATNQHVVAGNGKLQFQPLANSITLKFGTAQAAVGHDVMVIPVQPEVPGFEASTDISKDISIGDAVVVLGDPEGAGVVRPITGRILGIGPNLIEVSAQFVEGNSGSPIVHVKTGKVIGVATYASMKAFDTGAGQMVVQVRRFGYRLDSVQKWQPVDWAAYQTDAATATAAKAYTEALAAIFRSLLEGTFNPAEHKDPRLQPALARYPKAGATAIQLQQQADAFLRDLRNATKVQSDDLRRRLRYDFFTRNIEMELKLREFILNAIDETKARIVPPGTPNLSPSRTPRPLFN